MRPITFDRSDSGTVIRAAFCLTALILITSGFAAAGGPAVLGSGDPEHLPEIRVFGRTDQGLAVEFTLPTLLVEDVSAEGRTFQVLSIPGGADLGEVGEPLLPTFSRLLAIPDRAGVRITTSIEEEQEFDGILVVPTQEEGANVFAWNRATYERNDFGTASTARVGEPALLRGLRVVPLTFAPVRHNPAQEKIRVARRVRVDVSFEGEDLRNVPTAPAPPLTPSFERMYREMVVNFERPAKAQGLQHGTWLVICANSSQVTTRLQPLVDWRRRKGYPVRVATTAETGTSNTAIRAYIQNAYNTWSPPPEHVVLAGDTGGSYGIPTWYSGSGEGDHTYTQLAGNDLLADVHIGRLSFGTETDLERIVAKTVNYESNPEMGDTSWYTRACLVGDPSHSGYSTIQVMQWIKRQLLGLGYTDIDTIYGGDFVSQMSAALNQGDTFFAYRGYVGMSGWSSSNTAALRNTNKLCFGVMSTCGTGDFDGSTSSSEAFLRAYSASYGYVGAVGAIGTATLSTHTRYNNCFTFGVYHGVLNRDAWEMGAAHSWGKLNLYLNYYAGDPTGATNFTTWNNLMGDPAGEVFTGVPQALSVVRPTSLPVGTTSVPVTVTQGGQPCAGALVCLSQPAGGGGNELFVTGTTDAAGQLELAIPPAAAGTMKFTVTKHDALPVLADVPVTSPTVYVGYQGAAVDDDNAGASQGNGDGQINPGETVELTVQVRNSGGQSAANVNAVLTSDDPYVTLGTSALSFGTIAGGASAWSTGGATFTVDAGCPHGHLLRFGLDVISGTNQWHSVLELPAVSAELSAGVLHYYNAGGNGILDPGETVGLSVVVQNEGQAPAMSPVGTLLSLSEYITVSDGVKGFPSIAPGTAQENANQPFTVQAASSCPGGYQARMRLILQFSGAVTDTVEFNLPVGTRTATDPIGPDAYGYWAYDNTDTSYPEAPVFSWVEIDPNLGGQGAQVQLGDYGDYQDRSRALNLPFPFVYYGQTFTRATICTNGWVQMGDTYLTDYRNWTLPSPGGPDGCIAAFWDDLIEYASNPAGHVYQWHDAVNHRWIVEWSRMRNIYNSSTETFQAIFYDPAYHPTETGDGKIIFQYQTVSITDPTDGYCTVGIESPDNTDGLTYTYFNRYPAGAPALTAGRAISFVPKREVLTGVLHGTVRNSLGPDLPLSGATVTVVENGHAYETGLDGSYQGNELTGTYTLIATRNGFAPDTAFAVSVTAGSSTQVDFSLNDILPPVINMVTQPASTTDTLGVHLVGVNITDDSPLEKLELFYRVYDTPFHRVALETGGGPSGFRAQIPAQLWTSRVDYYIDARDEAGNTSVSPPGAPGELYSFWVGPLLTAYASDFEGGAEGWAPGSPEDDATSGVWEQIDPNGTWHNGTIPVQPEDDRTPDPGVTCWITGNAPPGSGEDVNDVDGGLTTLTSPRLDLTVDGTVLLRYWRWYTNDTGGGQVDDEWVVQVSDSDGADWVDLERTSSSAREWRQFEFDLGQYISLNDQARIRFRAADVGTPSIVEAALDDIEIVYIGLTPSAVPAPVSARFGFDERNVNPLRPGAAIHFGMDRGGRATLTVFDVQGRAVRRLLDGRPLDAGPYAVLWNGRDDEGATLPSGVYFYRLEVGDRAERRKVLLIH